MRLDAVVLAAGKSSRMGFEKALLPVDGRPLVAHHVDRYLQVCRRVVLVVRPDIASPMRAALGALACDAVTLLPALTESPAESLAWAVQHLDDDTPAIVTPVDLLPCRLDTLARLVAALDDPCVVAATPRHRGRGGHPVLLRGVLLDPYRRASAACPPPLRQLLERAGDSRVRVEVDDPRVLGDFDTRADLAPLSLDPG